jgi:hypothetical protein
MNRELNQDVIVVVYMLNNAVICSVINFVVPETNTMMSRCQRSISKPSTVGRL